MKRTFLLKTMLLLCALIAGSSSVWADDSYTITFANSANGATGITSSTQASTTIAQDSRTYVTTQPYTINSGNCYYGDTQNCIRIGKSGNASSLSIALSNDGKVSATTIVIRCNNTGGNNNSDATLSVNGKTAQTTTTTTADYTFTINADIESITLEGSASIRIYSITVNYATTPAGTTAAPTISGDTRFLNNTTVTITNATSAQGADIYYTLNNDDPTTTTSETCFAYSAPFTIDATTTVKAIAKKSTDTNASSVVSKTFTKATLLTVADAHSAIDEETTNDVDFVKGIIAQIGSLNNDGQLTYWISDNGGMTNNIQCYQGKNVGGAAFTATTNLEVGDIVIVKGQLEKNTTTYRFKANNEVVSMTTRTKVNIATFDATTTTLVLGGTTTTETTVTNDQAGWTPVSYSYTSNNESVATVDENGVITAVAKGTANITVTPNVLATNLTYKAGTSMSIEITVKNPSHTATFSVNGVTSNISVEEGDKITFPEDPAAISGKTFQGWTETAISGNQAAAPVFIDKSNTNMDNHDMTFYAVFGTEKSGGADSWIETALADITTSDVFVFSTGSYAMKNNNGTTSAPSATSITVSNGKITSTVTDDLKWNVSGTATDGYTFYPNGSTTTWLYCNTTASSSSNNNIRVGTGDRKVWKFDANGYLITNDTYTTRYLSFYSGSDFRSYINTDNGVFVPKFYKKSAGITIIDYCTTVPSNPSNPVDNGNGTITLTTTANMDGWRTFYDANQGYTADDNTTVYVASENTATKVTLSDIGSKNIPSGTPVILKTTDTSRQITLTEGNVPAFNGTNALYASTEGENLENVYRLGYGNNGISFYKYSTTSATAGIVYVPNVGSNAPSLNIEFGSGATSIETIKSNDDMREVYNLNGQRIAQPTKGLYIVNGKKVVIK